MNIDPLINSILASYESNGGVNLSGHENFPNKQNVIDVLNDLEALIFPGFKTADYVDKENLPYVTGERIHRVLSLLTREIEKAMIYTLKTHSKDEIACVRVAEQTSYSLIESLPKIRTGVTKDIEAIIAGDPAALSVEEVILSYPGVYAVMVYRIANFLHKNGVPLIPRIMSEYAHSGTGIDIHPGAKIGDALFIDHGTGIVIGETTVIGNCVKIYQGVTLGALSVQKKFIGKKRHPTIEDNVTIYSNATILGGETVIGKGSTIGGNAWITKSVPPGSITV